MSQSFLIPVEGTPTLDISTEGRRFVSRLTLRNTAEGALKNIRIWENGGRDWSSAESILQSILRERTPANDREKALCIFDYVHDHIEREAYRSRWDCFDVWKTFNCYGMGHCEVHSRAIAALWEMAGLASVQANVGFKPGLDLLNHTMAEVFYEGAWRLFDSHGANFFLGTDNQSILGWKDLWENPDLIQRSGPVGDLYAPFDHALWMDPETYDWTFDHKTARTEPWKGEIFPELTLSPGDSVTYERDGGLTYINNINDFAPPRVPHSRAIFRTGIPTPSGRWTEIDRMEGFEEVNGEGLRLDSGESGSVRIDVRTPYPIVSATLETAVTLEGDSSVAVLKVRPLGHPERDAEPIQNLWGSKTLETPIALGARFDEWNDPFARYGYSVILEATTQSGGVVILHDLQMETACQVATCALPSLDHAPWVVSSSPETSGVINIEIVSLPYPNDLSPPKDLAADRIVSGTESWIELKWSPSIGEESGLEYEVDLSDDSNFRWTLLPYLTYFEDRRISSYRVPSSFFPEDSIFYFRVRTRNDEGLRSEWSDTLEFSTGKGG